MRLAWSLRSLVRHPVRTALVIAGIAVAAALLLDMVMLAGGMERSFSRMLVARGFQIRVSPKGTLPFDTEATIPDITPLVLALRADPDVARVGPIVAASLHTRVGDSLLTLMGWGADPVGQGIYEIESGTDLAPGDTTGLLTSAATAARTGWRVGDTVLVLGRLDPQSARAGVERRLVVRGLARWIYDARDQRSVGVDFRVMQRLGPFPDRDVASMLMVQVEDDSLVEAVAQRVRSAHRSVEVNSVAALVKQFRGRLVYFEQLSIILATISLVVAALLIGTVLAITVNERLGELAVLRAIGVSRGAIVRTVMLEGALLTALGSTLGIALGLGTARYLDAILKSFPGLPAVISFFVPEAGGLAGGALTVLASGLLAGSYPAWLAARAPIAGTLRSEAE